MHYGHPKHTPSSEDLTLLKCSCGWRSEELTQAQLRERGLPWYCDACGRQGLFFIHFHPSERVLAHLCF